MLAFQGHTITKPQAAVPMTHPGTSVPQGPWLHPSPRPPLPSLAAPPTAEQLLSLTLREPKQARQGGAGFSVMTHLQTPLYSSLYPL